MSINKTLEQRGERYGNYSDNNMGDDSHIENHISPLCKVGVK